MVSLTLRGKVRYSGSWFKLFFMGKEMRLRGKRLVVLEAPEPSTILWENYGYHG